jgi:DNA-binding beta-propeller fold protein YncE
LVKTIIVNVKDPNAGLTNVFYFTSRGAPGNGHFVILDGTQPIVSDFTPLDMTRPYGIAVDTANKKVYITDYSNQAMYRFNADGTGAAKILDAAVPGQEIVGDAEAIFIKGDKVYWGRTGGIYRCNLDGSSPEEYINTGGNAPEFPIDMQYDPESNKIYLVNDKTDYSGGLWVMNFDGTGITQIVPDIDGTAIEVDFRNGKIYTACYAADGTVAPENGIYMCNMDGSNFIKIGDIGAKATWGVALDTKANKLFWSYKISNSDPDGKIIRANLDGTGQEDWLTGVSPHAMTIALIKL